MADDQNPIVEILVKYALNEFLSEEESRLLEDWRSRSEGHDALPDQLRDPEWIAEHRRLLNQHPAPIVPIPVPFPYRIGWRKPVLAVVCVLLVVGGWMLVRRPQLATNNNGVPANFQALLTREDGSMLVMDTLRVGGVVDGIAQKTDSNTLTYTTPGLLKHRLLVSRESGPWRILLRDGSRVVVKPGSSLEYSADLRVSRPVLDGEAWFGIARYASRPVTIEVGGAEVRVLGTEFDASAYGGETRVMLYSGAVRVRKGGDSLVLRPGQAAVASFSGLAQRAMNDSERVLAWRGRYGEEEFFDFENSPLPAMLKALAGWYGVQVSNPASLQGVPLTGKLPRSLPLNDMLRALEKVEKGHVRLWLHSETILVLPGHSGG